MKFNFFKAEEAPMPEKDPVMDLSNLLRRWDGLQSLTDRAYAGDNEIHDSLIKEIVSSIENLSSEDVQRAYKEANLNGYSLSVLNHEIFQHNKIKNGN